MLKINPANLIPRAKWGAKFADGFGDRPVPITEFWLHHSVTPLPNNSAEEISAVRLLEKIGQERFGGGISYNVPVMPSGRAFVGVSWWRRGAHTKGHNTPAVAFVLVGDYNKAQVTSEQMEAIAATMVEARRKGIAERHTLNGGHQQASGNTGTECPGKNGMAAIPLINALAERMWKGNDMSVPNPVPGETQTSKDIWRIEIVETGLDKANGRVTLVTAMKWLVGWTHEILLNSRANKADIAAIKKKIGA